MAETAKTARREPFFKTITSSFTSITSKNCWVGEEACFLFNFWEYRVSINLNHKTQIPNSKQTARFAARRANHKLQNFKLFALLCFVHCVLFALCVFYFWVFCLLSSKSANPSILAEVTSLCTFIISFFFFLIVFLASFSGTLFQR